MRIPGTNTLKGVPHYTNYRRLAAFEKAAGIRISGRHLRLLDWLLPAVCTQCCPHCAQLGVLYLGGAWRVCPHCEGAVWTVSPALRRKLRWWISARFPEALV
jgi:hypothetical protein